MANNVPLYVLQMGGCRASRKVSTVRVVRVFTHFLPSYVSLCSSPFETLYVPFPDGSESFISQKPTPVRLIFLFLLSDNTPSAPSSRAESTKLKVSNGASKLGVTWPDWRVRFYPSRFFSLESDMKSLPIH